jgi:hypothetical protein
MHQYAGSRTCTLLGANICFFSFDMHKESNAHKECVSDGKSNTGARIKNCCMVQDFALKLAQRIC